MICVKSGKHTPGCDVKAPLHSLKWFNESSPTKIYDITVITITRNVENKIFMNTISGSSSKCQGLEVQRQLHHVRRLGIWSRVSLFFRVYYTNYTTDSGSWVFLNCISYSDESLHSRIFKFSFHDHTYLTQLFPRCQTEIAAHLFLAHPYKFQISQTLWQNWLSCYKVSLNLTFLNWPASKWISFSHSF